MGFIIDYPWDDYGNMGPFTSNQETRRIKMAKKKARKATKRGSTAAKLSDWVLQQREVNGYNPNPEGHTTAERLGGGPCPDGVRAFEFLESLEKRGYSVAKICEIARDKNPTWYETHILEEGGLDRGQRDDTLNYLREAADYLESGLDNATDFLDNTDESVTAKLGTAITVEVKRLRDLANELENEPEYPIMRIVGKKGSLQLEIVK